MSTINNTFLNNSQEKSDVIDFESRPLDYEPLISAIEDSLLAKERCEADQATLSAIIWRRPNRLYNNYIFNKPSFSFKSLIGLEFNNNEFNKGFFSNSKIWNTSFNTAYLNKCSLQGADVRNSSWNNVIFYKCDLSKTVLQKSEIVNSIFFECSLTEVSFNSSVMNNVVFLNCWLDSSSFLSANVAKSFLVDCRLENALLCDAEQSFAISGDNSLDLRHPVIAFGWDYASPRPQAKIQRSALQNLAMNVLCYDLFECNASDEELKEEINELMGRIVQTDQGVHLGDGICFPSIPQALLASASNDSAIQRTKNAARNILQYADALFLPGGHDIEPLFYGEQRLHDTCTERDLKRSVLEFALLQAADEMKMPVMGICRGFQIRAVYDGGKISQMLNSRHYGIQELNISRGEDSDESFISHLFGGATSISGDSKHRQGVCKGQLGHVLKRVLEFDEVVKGAITPDERCLFLQFHPETCFVSASQHSDSSLKKVKNNERFFEHFVSKAHCYQKTKSGIHS